MITSKLFAFLYLGLALFNFSERFISEPKFLILDKFTCNDILGIVFLIVAIIYLISGRKSDND